MGLAALTAIAVGACGDGTGPGGDLTEEEAAALVQALTAAAAPLGSAHFALGPIFNEAELGEFGGYTATATQVYLTEIRPGNTATSRWIGLLGWNGFDVAAGTVNEATGAFFIDFDSPNFVTSFDRDAAAGGVLAFARVESTGSHYYPVASGRFTMAAASFGPPADCAVPPDLGAGAEITECTISTGSMQGSLGYVVNRLSGTGPATFTQAQDVYDLPAVRLVLTVDYPGAATARGAR